MNYARGFFPLLPSVCASRLEALFTPSRVATNCEPLYF
jgi:hypothetical protein